MLTQDMIRPRTVGQVFRNSDAEEKKEGNAIIYLNSDDYFLQSFN